MTLGQQEIGRRIYEARMQAGLTQKELADKVDLSEGQSISRYERGESEVPQKRLRRIAEATGKPLSFFVNEPISVGEEDRFARLEGEVAKVLEIVLETQRRLDDLLAQRAASGG